MHDNSRRPSIRSPLIGLSVALAALAVTIGVLTLNYSGSQYPGASTTQVAPTATENPQMVYQAAIVEERGALSPGYVLVPKTVQGKIDKPVVFSIAVCGVDARRIQCKSGSGPTSAPGEIPDPARHDVKVGSQLRARATTTANAELTAQSTEQQPIIASTDAAVWSWTLRPKESGRFTIDVVLSTLRQDSDEALLPDVNFPITLEVDLTAAHVVKSTNTLLTVWLPIIGTILATLGLGEFLRRRRARKKPKPKPRRRR